MSNIFLEILDEQEMLDVPAETIRLLAVRILEDAGIVAGMLSIVLVDNATIHELNKQFLQHDYPTDVISFRIEEDAENNYLEGEIVVSAEMARERAPEFGWLPAHELLLYIVHGILHLVGFDDAESDDRQLMRQKEQEYLGSVGIAPPPMEADDEDDSTDEYPSN